MSRSFHAMGRLKWLNLGLMSLVPIASYYFFWKPAIDPQAFGHTILGPTNVGPLGVVIGGPSIDAQAPGTNNVWRIRFCAECFQHIAQVTIGYGGPDTPPPAPRPARGGANDLSALLVVPENTDEAKQLWLTVHSITGQTYTTSWQLRP
jgi:hypothetical protein